MKRQVDPPAFVAMLQESKRLGWPTRFERDLTYHDRLWVERLDSGTAFVWAVHEGGTHAFTVDYRGTSSDAASLIRSVAETFPGAKFFGWDGRSLRPLPTAEDAQAWVRSMREERQAQPHE